jgi:hypothetical protein
MRSTNMIRMDLLLLVVKIQILMPYFPKKLFLKKEHSQGVVQYIG